MSTESLLRDLRADLEGSPHGSSPAGDLDTDLHPNLETTTTSSHTRPNHTAPTDEEDA